MTIVGTHRAPPFDPELSMVLAQRPIRPTFDIDSLVRTRGGTPENVVDGLLAAFDVVRDDRSIPGHGADPDVTVSVLRRRIHSPGGPGLLYAHGGGMVVGDRFDGIDRILEWVRTFDAVAVTVEYRLAPEHRYPAAVHDCFAALTWAAEHAAELGFDPSRLVTVGISAGAGLVAGATLMARDRGGPSLAGQILMCPMLDDRNSTVSSHQIQGIGVWDRASNQGGWRALLGAQAGTDQVSAYAAPCADRRISLGIHGRS